MDNTTVNHREAWDSFEFWFAMPGGGTFAHADAYNEMTISAQLRGRKAPGGRPPGRPHVTPYWLLLFSFYWLLT